MSASAWKQGTSAAPSSITASSSVIDIKACGTVAVAGGVTRTSVSFLIKIGDAPSAALTLFVPFAGATPTADGATQQLNSDETATKLDDSAVSWDSGTSTLCVTVPNTGALFNPAQTHTLKLTTKAVFSAADTDTTDDSQGPAVMDVTVAAPVSGTWLG